MSCRELRDEAAGLPDAFVYALLIASLQFNFHQRESLQDVIM